MKHAFLATVGALVLFISCRKGIEPIGYFPNPLSSDYQVVEYHKPENDNQNKPPYPNHFPYLFKKIYDRSGMATEIDCCFNSEHSFDYLVTNGFYLQLKISQRGRMVYLINKQLPKSNIPDTVMRVTLNAIGRAESISGTPEMTPSVPREPASINQRYIYKNNIVVAVQTDLISSVAHNTYIDSLHYDNSGNLLSFFGNSFQYDYTRTAKQQFYCEGYMGSQEPFYLLQYLGYFPEVNSPNNVMISTDNIYDDWQGPLTNHSFDRAGRLIGYDFISGHTTITWK